MTGKTAIGLMLLLCALPALAEDEPEEQQNASEDKVCIRSNLVRNFDGLTDEYLFVEERSKKYYLLTLRPRCTGLRHARGIALKDTTSRICSGGFGEVIVRERGIGPRTCRIEKIESVENKDEARAIIAEREEYDKARKDDEDRD